MLQVKWCAVLPTVFYGCETWSVTDEYRLTAFENSAEEDICVVFSSLVVTDWRKLHNEELHDLYCSTDIVWVVTWAGHVAHTRQKRNACRVLVGKREETTW